MSRPQTETTTDGKTVWVNDALGMCIGRFSALGVDVHRGAEAQMRGEPQCLDCIHDGEPAEMWERFKLSMLSHHGVTVTDAVKPRLTRSPFAGRSVLSEDQERGNRDG